MLKLQSRPKEVHGVYKSEKMDARQTRKQGFAACKAAQGWPRNIRAKTTGAAATLIVSSGYKSTICETSPTAPQIASTTGWGRRNFLEEGRDERTQSCSWPSGNRYELTPMSSEGRLSHLSSWLGETLGRRARRVAFRATPAPTATDAATATRASCALRGRGILMPFKKLLMVAGSLSN